MIRLWQYNGVAPWGEIALWCANHLSPKTHSFNQYETIMFFSEADYIAFMLRWS